AVATFPKSWPRDAIPRLGCSGAQAMRTLRRRAVGWLPSRYKRWLSSGLNWKTKWPWASHPELDAAPELSTPELVPFQLDFHQIGCGVLPCRHARVRRNEDHCPCHRAVALVVVGI